jgi:hypothetical protein
MKIFGPIGAAVCTIIWLIARPDRQTYNQERAAAIGEGDRIATLTDAPPR